METSEEMRAFREQVRSLRGSFATRGEAIRAAEALNSLHCPVCGLTGDFHRGSGH